MLLFEDSMHSFLSRLPRLCLPPHHPALLRSHTTVLSARTPFSSHTHQQDQLPTTVTDVQYKLSQRNFSHSSSLWTDNKFDETILNVIVCPLTKKPLRYDKENNELISDGIGVAYPIQDGIPNLVPQDARMLKDDKKSDSSKDCTKENQS